MPRKSGKRTAAVISNVLYTDDDYNGLAVGSEKWSEWLVLGQTFYFDGQQGTFTARSEKRRNGRFWYAFRTVEKKLLKVYMGRSEDLTSEKLLETVMLLNRR